MMSISELEKAYQQLLEQLLRGELDEEEFKTGVEKLRFEDDQGQQWKIGWYTGKWYRYDQGQWLRGKPRERQVPGQPVMTIKDDPQRDDKPARRPLTNWLVAGLVGLLLVAGILLIIGWNTDWWRSPDQDTMGAAPEPTGTSQLLPTETAVPSTAPATVRPSTETAVPSTASATARSPTATSSHTPQPTKTRRVPTATSTVVPSTASPTGTISPSSTPTLAPSSTPTALPSPSAPRALSGLSGRIFFPVYDPSHDRQTFDIQAVRLDSGKRERVVGQASQPALSPDGERLVYRSWDSAQRGIWVQDLADGHTWFWLSFNEAERPSWSPDSQNIVFASQQEPDRQWRIYRTWGLEPDRVRRHGGDILGRVPAWLADGRIAYWECPMNDCGLYAMSSDGSQPARLTTYEHDTAPAGSPDASQIAFMSNQSGNWEIYIVGTHPPEGQAPQSPRQLTRNAARDGLPTWSPDGKWLAFVTDRSGVWAIWVMRPDGADQQKLFDLGGPLEGQVVNIPPSEQHGWTWEAIAWGP